MMDDIVLGRNNRFKVGGDLDYERELSFDIGRCPTNATEWLSVNEIKQLISHLQMTLDEDEGAAMDEIPESVISEWQQQCSCCPVCSPTPCDGVMAGGVCDGECSCEDEEEIEPEL